MSKNNAVLVIGAGVGGIKAALDLAETGFKVYLCDRSPGVGGTLIQLDKWFPDNHCGLCQMLPVFFRDRSSQFCLRRGLIHPNIQTMPLTEIRALDGEAGNFTATAISRASGVDPQLCIGCGFCAEVCPVQSASEFDQGLTPRKAIYTAHPYLLPQTFTIDWHTCTRCEACVEKCPTRAIRLDDTEEISKLEVGAVILSTGFEEFDPRPATQYGYGRFPNVVTSIELERILSPIGPNEGKLLRPSDHKPPRSIAFLQCIGSRDRQRDYCSSVCCMFALKEATLIKETYPDIDAHIFFMDMRAFGKGYHRYYERAREELGIQFTRCRVPVVKEDPQSRNLIITTAVENGTLLKREFDLLVLSVGQTPPPGFRELCRVLGVEVNRWGFSQTNPLSPVDTSREGVYVCGCASEPKDIVDTLTEAGAAACQASTMLAPQPTQPALPEIVPEAEEEPRLGVFLCHCGEEISSALDLEQLTEFSQKLPGVVYVEQVPLLCQPDAIKGLVRAMKDHKLNGLVLGACASYRNILMGKTDLDSSSFELVNLREHVARVHQNQSDEAMEKAKRLLAIAVEKANAQDTPSTPIKVQQKALVVGGGLAGLTAAQSIAARAIEVHLAEKSSELGSNMRHIYGTLEGADPQIMLKNIMGQIEKNPLIHLHMESEMADVNGYAGNFEVSLKDKEAQLHPLEVGAIVVATGGEESRPAEYLYGQNKRVITQKELEDRLQSGEIDTSSLNSVAMIQCVGSRYKERPYCSRVCCAQALKNALKLKGENPDIEIAILYRDIMSYGFREEYYTQAREKGIQFIRYEVEEKPSVREDENRVVVEVKEPALGGKLVLEPDLVVLSTGIMPADNAPLARILGVELNEDGFFQEAETKFRPTDFLVEGIFVCGLAHSPRGIKECTAQALAAAQRAVSLLNKERLISGKGISETVARRCSRCELCIEVCPYTARTKDPETEEIVVREALCRGCGACVVACPNGAARLRGFQDRQVFSLIDAAL